MQIISQTFEHDKLDGETYTLFARYKIGRKQVRIVVCINEEQNFAKLFIGEPYIMKPTFVLPYEELNINKVSLNDSDLIIREAILKDAKQLLDKLTAN